ncbi:hypothetical protein [Luedemannella flava]|uniref:hypothetical protein n=1 Tax=Luedemannella flava TaxID=349316 RepID=UPI0031D33A42
MALAASGCAGDPPKTDPILQPAATTRVGPLPVNANAVVPQTALGPTGAGSTDAVAVVSDTYIVRPVAAQGAFAVRRRSDNTLVLTHRTTRGLETTFADLAGDLFVVADDNVNTNGGTDHPSVIYIYDLRTKRRTTLADVTGAPRQGQGQFATLTDDGRLYYVSVTAKKKNTFQYCVGMADLRTMRGSTVECANEANNPVFVAPGEDGATWTVRSYEAICDTGRGIRGGRIIPIGPADCATVGTGTVRGWSVWAATLGAGGRNHGVTAHATDGTTLVDLGEVTGISFTTCGDYVYWSAGPGQPQIRRWSPGMTEIEVAYDFEVREKAVFGADPDDRGIVLAGCADNLMTLATWTRNQDRSLTTRFVVVPSRRG